MFGICTFLILFVLSFPYTTKAMRCFECSDIPSLEDCNVVRQCNTHEVCYVRQVVTASGHITYYSGCRSRENCIQWFRRSIVFSGDSSRTSSQNGTIVRRSDSLPCDQCCDKEFCNNQGCGQTATPVSQRGPYCFSCIKQAGQNACRDVKQCGTNEVCLVEKLLVTDEIVFKSHCIELPQCETIKQVYSSIIGKRSPEVVTALGHVLHEEKITHDNNEIAPLSERSVLRVHLCILCCDTDFCNDHCVKNAKRRNIFTSKNWK